MATEKTPATSAPAEPERVYIEIPRAKPGQGYKAPKNYENRPLALLSKVVMVALCLSLPGAVGLIFGMILAFDPNARAKFLWLWIPLILFIMITSLLLAFGVAREALGVSGVLIPRSRREKSKSA
jgi:hypothetical protein